MLAAARIVCDDWQAHDVSPEVPVLGVPDGPFLNQTEPEALAVFEEILLMLQVAGCTVKRVEALTEIDKLNDLHRRLVFGEFAREHADLFAAHESAYRPRTAEAIRTGQGVSDAELAELRKHPAQLRGELEEQMAATGIDLWVCPAATGPAPTGLDYTGDPNMNLPWTHAGMPALTLPAGVADNGLPLGMQLVGGFGCDEQLLAWAAEVLVRIPEPVDAEF